MLLSPAHQGNPCIGGKFEIFQGHSDDIAFASDTDLLQFDPSTRNFLHHEGIRIADKLSQLNRSETLRRENMIDPKMPPEIKQPLLPLQARMHPADHTLHPHRLHHRSTNKIHSIVTRQRKKQFALPDVRVRKRVYTGTIADDDLPFDLTLKFSSTFGIALDHGNLVFFSRKLNREMAANFSGSDNDDIHGNLLGTFFIIGFDDSTNNGVAHNIVRVKIIEANALNPFKGVFSF